MSCSMQNATKIKDVFPLEQDSTSVKLPGRLICVGTGIQLGQISVLSQSYIEIADVVFSLVTDGFAQRWLASLNDNVQSLQPFYAKVGELKNRRETYKQMVDEILTQVRYGKLVVCAFYGHPGVFASVGHRAIKLARDEGFETKMLPGISAEASLWADLGIDPASVGHQSFEATQFLLYNHFPNTRSHLLLWQIALAGEHTLTHLSTTQEKLEILVAHLNQWYSLEHSVIVYEAATLPFQQPRIESITLAQLPYIQLNAISTLMIPPAEALSLNHQILAQLGITEANIG